MPETTEHQSVGSTVSGAGSAGQVGFFTGVSQIAGDDGLFWDNVNKRLGIGTKTPSETLHVVGNSILGTKFAAGTDSSIQAFNSYDLSTTMTGAFVGDSNGESRGINFEFTVNPTANVSGFITQADWGITANGTHDVNQLFNMNLAVDWNSTGLLSQGVAGSYYVNNDNAGTIALGSAVQGNVQVFDAGDITVGACFEAIAGTLPGSTGGIPTLYGFIARSFVELGGNIGNAYGLYVEDQTAGTGNWAIKTGLGLVQFGDTLTFGTVGAKLFLYDGGNPARYGFATGSGSLEIFTQTGSGGGTQIGIWDTDFTEQFRFASNGSQYFINADFTNPITAIAPNNVFGVLKNLDLFAGGDGSEGGLYLAGIGSVSGRLGLRLDALCADGGPGTDPVGVINFAKSDGATGYTQIADDAVGLLFSNADIPKAAIYGDGKIDANVGGIKTKTSIANVSSPPTQAELVSAFGAASVSGTGFVATVNDNNADTAQYIVVSNGTSYWYGTLTKAA